MNLFYITFGKKESIHLQAAFSVYSFALKKEIDSITVITDAPEYYQHIKNLITILEVNEDLINEWKGPYQFFWRVKIKALELIINKYPGEPVVYLDTDTFLYGDPEGLQKNLQHGKALMHQNEGRLSTATSKTEKKMWHQVAGKTFGGVKITPAHSMWNAGVVATPNTKEGKEGKTALELCDEMCATGITPRLIEQFALSVALEEVYGVLPAVDIIAHYWSNKDGWNKKISFFFIRQYFKGVTQNGVIEAVQKEDLRKTAIEKKERNTANRLYKLIDKIFPVKNVKYLP